MDLVDIFKRNLNIESLHRNLISVRTLVKCNVYYLTKRFRNKKNIIFYIDTPFLFLHIEPIWKILRTYNTKINIYFLVRGQQINKTIEILRKEGIKKENIILDKIEEIYFADLFISPTQWCIPPKGKQRNIQIFHGLSSKGVSFPDGIKNFDILFFPNSIFKDLYINNFLKKYPDFIKHTLYEVGYPKLDDLYNRKYNRDEIFKKLNLDPDKITVMYAPTYLREGSLFTHGIEIIETVLHMNVNLLVKLHPGSYHDVKNIESTGGIDWKKKLSYYEKHDNFRNILDINSNPYLFISDILITDISSIASEFLILDRPIIYFDVPELFTKSLTRIFKFSEEEAKKAYCDPRCTTGRNTGILIKSVSELKDAINQSIKDPMKNSPKRKELMKDILYNPGNSAEKSAQIIINLIEYL